MSTTMQARLASAIESTLGEHVDIPDSLSITVGDIRVDVITTQSYRGARHRTQVLAQRYTVSGHPVSVAVAAPGTSLRALTTAITTARNQAHALTAARDGLEADGWLVDAAWTPPKGALVYMRDAGILGGITAYKDGHKLTLSADGTATGSDDVYTRLAQDIADTIHLP